MHLSEWHAAGGDGYIIESWQISSARWQRGTWKRSHGGEIGATLMPYASFESHDMA